MHSFSVFIYLFFFFKQKKAYEMRISDWSSDVCSSDLVLDLVEDLLIARLAPIFISNDRPARCLDLALALQAIKGLQRLYGVARFGSDERAAHDRIEVDKGAVANEAVEKGRGDTRARGATQESEERRGGEDGDKRR